MAGEMRPLPVPTPETKQLLGGHAGWRVTAAALRRLPAYVLSAPAVLSEMRLAQGLDREIQR